MVPGSSSCMSRHSKLLQIFSSLIESLTHHRARNTLLPKSVIGFACEKCREADVDNLAKHHLIVQAIIVDISFSISLCIALIACL